MSSMLISDVLHAEGWSGDAYTARDAFLKGRFHRLAAARLRHVAKLLGLAPGTYDVRSNKAGIAISGEVTLHSDRLYVDVNSRTILYRTCKGRKDYSGGQNHYLPVETLDEPRDVALTLKYLLDVSHD